MAAARQLLSTNLRRENRYPVNQRALITLVGEPEVRIRGRIRDVSRNGLCLAVPDPVPAHGAVKVEWNRRTMLGTITYCARSEQTYLAGVRLFSSWESCVEEMVARHSQELARANADLETLAFVASHDCQEPLAIVLLYLELLVKRPAAGLDPEARQFVERALEASLNLRELMQNLMAYLRAIRTGGDLEPVNCESVVRTVAAGLPPEAGEAVVIESALPVIAARELELRTLFQNLVANGLKFNQQRQKEVRISAAQGDGEWCFAVRDNGIGIERGDHARIFSLFERANREATYPGSGIGLAICKRIVERRGGRIWVNSEPGSGSTFYFTLPAAYSFSL